MSFRGEDTRLNFRDHLYAALVGRGIIVFRDNIKLQRGDPISANLFREIEESRFCIIWYSENYASSTSCLDEMEKIYDCMRSKEPQTVLLVFYYVDPSNVRKQTGGFDEAFAEDESGYGKNSEKVLKWRKAMTGVDNLLGWHLQNRCESVVIEDFVWKISVQVNSESPCEYESLVGMDSRAGRLEDRLLRTSDDVLFLGIPGMGGIGKTTIARVVYDGILNCWLQLSCGLREMSKKRGIVSLQEQLLSDTLQEKNISVPDVYGGIGTIKKNLHWRKVDNIWFVLLESGMVGYLSWEADGHEQVRPCLV